MSRQGVQDLRNSSLSSSSLSSSSMSDQMFTIDTPLAPSCLVVYKGVFPNSVMLAKMGTLPILSASALYSSSLVNASNRRRDLGFQHNSTHNTELINQQISYRLQQPHRPECAQWSSPNLLDHQQSMRIIININIIIIIIIITDFQCQERRSSP